MKTKNSTVEKRKGGLRNVKYLSGTLFRKMAKGGEKEIQTNADEVNRLNVFPVPDGDTGDNMRLTIESGIRAIENLDTDDLAQVMKLFSHGMLIGARGNSGVILSQFFSGMARGLEKEEKAAPKTIGRALEMGVEDAYTSVLTPTEGTILTVAREAVEYAVSNINEKSTVRTLFADLVGEMQRSLERTPEVLDILKEAGVVDSGGAGLYYIMDGFNRALCGEEIKDTAPKKVGEGVFPNISEQNEDIDLGYCTEFLLQLNRKKKSGASFEIDKFKKALSALGDSLIAFEKEGAVKVHIHTKTPEKAIAYGRKFGEFLTVKIENMSVQHSATAFSKNEKASKKKRYGIVAVSSGD